MADITLTAAVRSNLSTLQSTASLISDTQERLSTGKKVNSALDNPNSFFTASSLNSRASDLSNLQDDIGQSVSTLEGADKGIEAIDKLLDAAKGKANQALQSKDAETRSRYANEFNELRTQIEDIAKDSGYKGKNLLGGDGNDLLVKFNEDGSSKLNISAVDYTNLDSDDAAFTLDAIGDTVTGVEFSDGKAAFDLGITDADKKTTIVGGTGDVSLDFGVNDSSGITEGLSIDQLANFEVGDEINFNDGTNDFTYTIQEGDDSTDIKTGLNDAYNQAIGAVSTATNVTIADGQLQFANNTSANTVTITHNDTNGNPQGSGLTQAIAAGGNADVDITTNGITSATTLDELGFNDGDEIIFTSQIDSSQTSSFTVGTASTTSATDLATGLQNALRTLDGDNTVGVGLKDGELFFNDQLNNVDISVVNGGTPNNIAGFNGESIQGYKTESVDKDVNAIKLQDLAAFSRGDVINFQQGEDGQRELLTIDENTTVTDLATAINDLTGVTASFDAATAELNIDNTTIGDTGQDLVFSYAGKGSGAEFGNVNQATVEADVEAVAGRGWGDDDAIESSLDQVRQAQLDLRAQASTFGTNLSVVTNRQDFTADLINTLEVGAGKLTLADSNLEGANLSALNTQNSIATSTLALATQAGQSVLQLIR